MKLQLSCLLSHSSIGHSIIIINIFISILYVMFERYILILHVSSIFEICFVLYFFKFSASWVSQLKELYYTLKPIVQKAIIVRLNLSKFTLN